MIFEKITFVGFGLIGSSMARAIVEAGTVTKNITAIDTNPEYLEQIVELGIADKVTDDFADGVKDADLVIIAVPVGSYETVAKQIAPSLKEGAIVTDVGSVKQSIIEQVVKHLPEHVHFIPGHPIAGTAHSGPKAGFADLFKNRWCILTPLPDSDIRAVEKITQLWEAIGSNIEIMDASRHDLILAITSHLPHLIAYTIVGTATDLEDHMQDDVITFSAGGFRDFTRIAASNPIMWRDIFMNNRDAVLEVLQRFTEDLTALQRAIRWGDDKFLEDVFTRTRDVRRKVIDAGQADYATATGTRERTPPVEAPQERSGSAVSGK